MNVLAIETTTKVLSVAIANENEIISEIFINSKLNHSKTLLSAIEDMLNKTGLTIEDMDFFAISDGPGSFTGLRIGGSTIKAFARLENKIIVKVPTLFALAYNIYDSGKLIIPMLDARRNTVYTGVYYWDNGVLVEKMPVDCLEVENLKEKYREENVVFLGDGAKLLGCTNNFSIAPINLNLPRAGSVAALSFALLNKEEYISNYLDYEPFYLKQSQAQREYEEKHDN